MYVADHRRLREREEIAIVQQVLLRVLEALAANIGFFHAVGANGRTHRSVDNGDSALENLLESMLVIRRHGEFLKKFRQGASWHCWPHCAIQMQTALYQEYRSRLLPRTHSRRMSPEPGWIALRA